MSAILLTLLLWCNVKIDFTTVWAYRTQARFSFQFKVSLTRMDGGSLTPKCAVDEYKSGPDSATAISICNIIYFDDDIIVANKPYNMMSVPAMDGSRSFAERITEIMHIPRVDTAIVHRLDYATSGIIVYARNKGALQGLHQQFRDTASQLSKMYTAVVLGRLTDEGEIELPLRSVQGALNSVVDPMQGKQSTTLWKSVVLGQNTTLVHLYPITGR